MSFICESGKIEKIDLLTRRGLFKERENMFKRYSKKCIILIGAVGAVVALEALTDGLKKEEYCIMNREPDIPTEHPASSLPYIGLMVAGTTSSTSSVDVVNF